MRKKIMTMALLAFTALTLHAQKMLTLGECIRIGIEQNLGLTQRKNQMRKSKESISEAKSNLLPQLNGYFNMNDNFEPQTTVSRSVAQDILAVSKQLQYNAQTGVQLNMPLYNQTLHNSIAIQRLLNDIDNMQYDKAREDLIIQITRLYYLSQMTAEQIRLTEGNIQRMQVLRDITQALCNNQVALEIDVQRVDINLKNLQVNCKNAKSMLEQQINTMKYVINYESGEEICFRPINVNEQPEVIAQGVSDNLPELEIIRGQQRLNEKQLKMIKQNYLPTVSLTGGYSWLTFSNEFNGWLTGSGAYKRWYNTYGIGLQVKIPIFDGFSKRHKRNKAKIDIENTQIALDNNRKNLQKEYLNSINDLTNNRRTYREQLENVKLAEGVYTVTADQYKEGLSGMTSLLQDEMNISAAQNNYVTAHYNYRVAALNLLKLSGKLDNLMK